MPRGPPAGRTGRGSSSCDRRPPAGGSSWRPLARLVPEPRRAPRLTGLHEPRILALEGRDDVGHGHVGLHAAVAHVFHVASTGPVIGLEDRVLTAIELQREDAEALAQGP